MWQQGAVAVVAAAVTTAVTVAEAMATEQLELRKEGILVGGRVETEQRKFYWKTSKGLLP